MRFGNRFVLKAPAKVVIRAAQTAIAFQKFSVALADGPPSPCICSRMFEFPCLSQAASRCRACEE